MKTQESRKDQPQQNSMDAPEKAAVQAKTFTPPAFQLKTSPVSAESEGGESEAVEEVAQKKGKEGSAFDDGDSGGNGGNGGGGAGGNGLPNDLKSGVESLSGLDMSDVKVHRNSDKPAQLNALAYAQGTDIHLGPGQEQHLPHEAWHVAQQKQGRVQPTTQMKGNTPVNDDKGLESEADTMGAKAMSIGKDATSEPLQKKAAVPGSAQLKYAYPGGSAMQLKGDGAAIQFAGVDVGILGDGAKDLAFSYMGEYWEELKRNFKLEDFLVALVKDLLDIVGVDLIKGATKALGETAAKLAGNIAQITKVLSLLVKVKEWIDRVPKPIKEFLKYLLGFFMKKVSKWVTDEGMQDATINTVIFGMANVMDVFGAGIAQLEALLGKLNALVAKGVEKLTSLPGVKDGLSWLGDKFGYLGDGMKPGMDQLSGAVTDLWAEAKKLKPQEKENEATELDLKFLWLKVKSPEVQRWTEKDSKGKDKEMGGLVLDSELGIRLSGNDFVADITVKINYSGDYRFKLESESVLLENGIGIEGFFNLQGLTLSQMEMSSEKGLSLLIVKLARIAFGPDVLVGENLRFQYKKDSKTPFEMDGGVQLNALGRSLNGKLHLGFNDKGGLGEGKFFITTGKEEFELIKDHLSIKNINAEGDWKDGKFESLMIKGDPNLNFSGARISGSQVGLEYKDGEGFAGKADSLLIEVDIMGATVGILVHEASIEENGFSADKVTLTYKGAEYKKQEGEQGGENSEDKDKVGLVQEFVPAFEASWISQALGVDLVEMEISNARINWGKKGKEEEGGESESTELGTGAESANGEQVKTNTTLAPVEEDKEGEKKTNVFTLRRLKASLFGITVDGAYKDETKTFEGTISSKLFGQDSGRKPATFSVQGKEEGAWEATINSLALLPENKAIGEVMNIGPIVLNKIVFGSGEGIKEMQLSVGKFGVAGDILAAEGILFDYTKASGVLETNATIYLKLLQEDPRLSGKLNLKFGEDGKLIEGSAVKEAAGEEFNLLQNHLLLSNPSFNAQFNGEAGLTHLSAAGNLGLNLPSAKVSAENIGFEFDKADKIFRAHVDELSGKVLLGEETLVMVLVQGAEIDKQGIRAESIKLTFSYGDEEAPKEDLQALTKAGDLQKLLPGFKPDLLKSVGGIDTFVLDLTTTNVSYHFGKEGEEQGEVKKASEDAEKKSETSLAIRKFKAHAFGFEIAGKYEENVFDASIKHEEFGGGKLNVNTQDPEKWVAKASEVDLQFGNRKLFGMFGLESAQLHELEYVSGQGVTVMSMTANKLDFGNGTFTTNKIEGKLTDAGTLEFAGQGVQLEVFGYKLDGGFKIVIDKTGKPTEIRATLNGATDIEAIKDVLRFTSVGGSVDWVNGALENMELHSGMEMNLPAGVSLNVPQAQFGYRKEEGMFAAVDEMRLGIRVSKDVQLLLRMVKGKVSRGADGVQFSADQLAATFAYGREIISPEKDVDKDKLPTLLPGLPTQWLDFAGLKVLVFTAAANQVKLGPKGLEVANWSKVIEAIEGGFMGLEYGYNGGNAEVGLGEGIGGMVENQLDKYTTGGEGSKEGLDKNDGKDSTGKKPMGPGGFVRGSWNKEIGIPAISMGIPILPGLSVGGGITANAGVGATIGGGIEKLPDLEEGKERFKLSGDAALKAFGNLKIELHATLGSEFIVAIQAGLFAQAQISAAAKGVVTGVILWDREKNSMAMSKRQEDKPRVDVDLRAALSASVGAEIKAKAFIFFEKKLWSYEFKKWDLGEWIMQGALEAGEDGAYHWNHKASGFGKDGGKPSTKPVVDAQVVTPLDVLQSGKDLDDKRLVHRIVHDILAPGSGYTPEQQKDMIKKLGELTDIDFSKEEGDFATMMSEMRNRQGGDDPSNMMSNAEWKAYSTTDSTFLFWTSETKRKSVTAVDMKLEQFHAAKDNEAKKKALGGSLTDDEIASKLPEIDLEKPTKKEKYRSVFERAGLVNICDLFLLKEDGSSRRDMVAKLRSDAVRELDRLNTPDANSRGRN